MHYTQLTLKYSNGTNAAAQLTIPVTLYVFDFTLPSQWHFHSQIAVDMTALSSTFRTVDLANGIMYNLKMSPRVITTPSGLGMRLVLSPFLFFSLSLLLSLCTCRCGGRCLFRRSLLSPLTLPQTGSSRGTTLTPRRPPFAATSSTTKRTRPRSTRAGT
jgi:hypothetical protein